MDMQSYSTIPLGDGCVAGRLVQDDVKTEVGVNINATVSGEFFKENGEWCCQRRKNISCNISFSLPGYIETKRLLFFAPGAGEVEVCGFAVRVSGTNSTRLVQLSAKRECKGEPEKVPLSPNRFGMVPSEHKFDRLQFEKATPGNGGHPSTQEYAQLVVELLADIGEGQFLRVAHRMTERIIVFGRKHDQKKVSLSSIDVGSLTVSDKPPNEGFRFRSREVRRDYHLVLYRLTSAIQGNARRHGRYQQIFLCTERGQTVSKLDRV